MVKALQQELIFEVVRSLDGAFSARCLNAEINLTGLNLQDLHDNISAAIESNYPVEIRPDPSQIHLVVFEDDALRRTRAERINSWG